ncbi:mechanosensitive ion channel family protein [Halioxenophilus sp. WMMB6]|uniref:mechanosensitive ion channel family protein n=1 Tax=Halioxenophilus sp. WMMB6 TaxID=3073815 RepID=UPI00295E5D76|nr:mechanosensitive ion channel family protein [Halioxenophilus sp. WMMB6]
MDPSDINLDEQLEQISAIYSLITEFLVNYSFQIIGAVIVLAIGLFISNRIAKKVENLCIARHMDVTLSHFLANALRIALLAVVAVIVLNKLGINITPMVAAIGALSLGAGLAVQGLLTNYSAGLNIIVTRPYVVGDTITLLGVTGIVKEVRLAATVLTNEDGQMITIPNRHVIGEIIHNSHGSRVVELEIGIAYSSNLELACAVVAEAVAATEGNDQRPAQVGVDNFADSAIVLGIRFWAPTDQYFEQKYKTNMAIFKALQANQIAIPFPQREVTLLNTPAGS